MSNSFWGAAILWLQYRRSGKSGLYTVFIRLLVGMGSVSLWSVAIDSARAQPTLEGPEI